MKRLTSSLYRLAASTVSDEWYLTPRSALLIFGFPLVAALLVALTVLDRPVYRFLTYEDRFLEWLQFAGYLTASLVGLAIAQRLWRAGRPLPALLYLGFAAGCFFVAGEEIAWGQRLLGLETPEALEAVNHQGEITLHNVSSLQTKFNVVMLLIGFYGSLGTWLIRWLDRRRSSEVVNLFVPPLFLTSSFLVLFGYKLLRFLVFPSPRYVVVTYGEVAEFCLAFGLAAFAVLSWHRLRRLANRPSRAADFAELTPRPPLGMRRGGAERSQFLKEI